MQNVSTLVHSGWELAQRPASGPETLWLPATVPGHIHSDLVRAGVIGDPLYRLQELSARWVDDADWTYKTALTVDAERLASRGAGRHFLVFHGIDTLGKVFLNGELLGTTDNYFRTWRFDVTALLREGENEIRVELTSALRFGQTKSAEYLGDGTSAHGKQTYFNFPPRAFVRKPQYMFGWDWGPELVGAGIPGKVELLTVPVAEILDYDVTYDLEGFRADIQARITVRKYTDAPLRVGMALYAPGDNTPDALVSGPAGVYTVEVEIEDQKVVRWHPNGRGVQKRYLLNLRVRTADTLDVVAHKGLSIGFRTVALDTTDGGMAFVVNGEKIFAKGANWIPDGCFPGEITKNRLRERLTQAQSAGFNMLRVWGGGLYESEDFYDLCDSLGLLVWQDFPLACATYPDDLPDFVESVKLEAVENVKRLRHRACLALWCGGNENLELHQGRWSGADQATEFFGEKLIQETFPEVLKAHDPRTQYLPNSPWGDEGEGNCTSEKVGDSHYWNVWHAKEPTSDGDWTNYAKSTCRFSSEFGFAAPAGLTAWDSVLAPEDKTVRSRASQWHDKTRKGYETYLGFIAMHYPAPTTFDDLVYYGQANQALAFSFGIEHWRRQRGHCMGTLYWQLNDCWPTHSWSSIDGAGEPKLAYYAIKKSYADLLLSLVRVDSPITGGEGAGKAGSVEAHLVSELRQPVAGTLKLRLLAFDGEELAFSDSEVTAEPNAASGALLELEIETRPDAFVHATFGDAEAFLLLDEPKNLSLPDPKLTVTADGDGALLVSAESFAAFVTLRFEGLEKQPALSDNGFHVAPGHTRRIEVSGLPAGTDLAALLPSLTVRHL